MTLDKEKRQIIVNLEVEKSFNNLAQAKLGIEHGYWDLVANRLYYALFHAITGLLIHDGISVKSHKGAILAFHNNYVKTGKFRTEEGRIVSYLQSKREEADYNCVMTIEKESIEPYICLCESMIQKMRDLCKFDN